MGKQVIWFVWLAAKRRFVCANAVAGARCEGSTINTLSSGHTCLVCRVYTCESNVPQAKFQILPF